MQNLKKLPSLLSVEELISQINQESPEEQNKKEVTLSEEDESTFLYFLHNFNIVPGNEPIKKNVMWAIYKAWARNPIKRKDFMAQLNSYFPDNTTVTNKQGTIYINVNAAKLAFEVFTKFKRLNQRLKQKPANDKLDNFLNYYHITDGSYWLEDYLLYFLYDKYSYRVLKINPNTPLYLSKVVFNGLCNVRFEKAQKNGTMFYAVNENVIKLYEPGQLERMRKEHAKEEKAKSKIRIRTPRTRRKTSTKNKTRSSRSRLST